MNRTNYICAGHGYRSGTGSPSNSEVCNLNMPVFIYQYVLGLNIPVDYIVLVGMSQSRTNLERYIHSLLIGYYPPLFNIILQGLAFYIFHHNIVNIVFLTHIIDIYYV